MGRPKKIIKQNTPKKTDIPKSAVDQKDRDEFISGLRKKGLIGDVKKKLDLISTGSWVVNRLIGDGTHKNLPGGVPRGYITEIYGDESTGKTTLALHIAKQTLLDGETVIYADFEHSLRTQFQYLENMGINTSSPNFVHLIPTSLEEGVKVIGECMVKLRPTVIIVDSVTAMIPQDTMEKDAGDPTRIGLHARLVGSFVNWIGKKLQKYNCAMILVNQLRANIKGQYDTGPKEITTGGKAIPFFTTLRIRLRATGNKEKVKLKSLITGLPEEKAISQEVKVIIEKNKMDMPFKSGPIYIVFGQGIDNVMSLVTLGINKNVIKTAGAGYFKWKDPNSDLSFNIQGKTVLKKYLEDNPKVLEALQPYLIPTKDEEAMDEIQRTLESKGVENLDPDEKEQLREIRKMKGQSTEGLEFTAEEIEDLQSLEIAIKGKEEPKDPEND